MHERRSAMPDDDVLKWWETEKQKHLDAAQVLKDKADEDFRSLTEKEREQVQTHLTSATEFQQKIQDRLDNESLDKSIKQLGRQLTVGKGDEEIDTRAARTWADAFLASDVYRGMKEMGGLPEHFSSPSVTFHAAVGDPLLPQTGTNADAIPETFVPTLETPGLRQEAVTLADLFDQVPVTTGNTVRYPILTTRTKASGAVVTPGSAKPYAEYAFDDVTVELEKRAAFVAVAEEYLEDAPFLRAFLNRDLPFMVRQNEETAFATDFYAAVTEGSAAPDITGGAGIWDAILAGVTDVRMNFFGEPDALFIHPLDWAAASAQKADTAGTYLTGGPNQDPSRNLWGSPARVVISQSAVEGFPIVGAFRLGGKVYRKGDVRLSASNSHDDFFIKNLVAIRGEVRSVLGITYPEAFSKIDINS
jgi:HK97 family phage major capsid protein